MPHALRLRLRLQFLHGASHACVRVQSRRVPSAPHSCASASAVACASASASAVPSQRVPSVPQVCASMSALACASARAVPGGVCPRPRLPRGGPSMLEHAAYSAVALAVSCVPWGTCAVACTRDHGFVCNDARHVHICWSSAHACLRSLRPRLSLSVCLCHGCVCSHMMRRNRIHVPGHAMHWPCDMFFLGLKSAELVLPLLGQQSRG